LKKEESKPTSQMDSILRFFTDTEKEQQKTYGLGTIKFSLAYDFSSSTLIVKIIKADNIPAMDISGTSDPFVKVCLLPDKKNKLETKVRRKTLNPQWNESLVFQNYPYEKISQRVLYLQMMDWDRFSRNDPIGEVFVQLNRVHLSSEAQTFTEAIAPCTASQKRGQLLISLMYVPLEGRLVLGVIKGSNLRAMDINGSSDPYTKVWLHYRGQRTEKKKTAVKKNTLNPEFNEQFEFYIPMEKLKDYTLEIIVMDKDRIGRNECIGKVILGHKGSSLERQHWRDMISSPKSPSSQWHVLKL